MRNKLPLLLATCALVLAGLTQAQNSNSTNSASLRVGDYATTEQLTNGTALPLWSLVWRAVGSSFATSSAPLNSTFDQDANSAFLEARHSMVYTVVNIRNAASANTTRKLDGRQVDQIVDANASYSSVDLLLRATFTQNSDWEDLGVTQEMYRQQVSQYLVSYGWNVTAVVPMRIQLTSDAASILALMPLPQYTSHQVVLQVVGANLVPTSVQTQNLITDTLMTMLASDHVFLMRLTSIEETSPRKGAGTAGMTYVMQKSAATADVSTALQLALGRPETPGSQAASPFSKAMLTHGMNVTASVSSETAISGDSIQDQIYALTTVHKSSRKHLGAIVGSSVGSAAALVILLITAFTFGRGWLKKRRLQKRAAAWHKEQAELADLENGKTSFHDSGSSLPSHSSPALVAGDEVAAAKCWDIDAADIVICKHADGTQWLLNESESGQIFKAIRAGVQDVIVKVLNSSTNLASEDLRQEVDVLKSVSYDRNVVQFYGTCPHGDQTMLVLEYMEGGDLRHALMSMNGELSWPKKASIALDIVRGLHFLHSHGVMHMNLKAANVLLTKTYNIAKVGDVDQAQVMNFNTRQQQHPAPFAISAYLAPELVLGGNCTEKVDMYSFGVILWELITTEVPRRGRLRAIKVPQECPAEIEQLIDLCLATEPSDRPTAKQAFDIISACSPTLAAPSFTTDAHTRQHSAPLRHPLTAGRASGLEHSQANQSIVPGPSSLHSHTANALERGLQHEQSLLTQEQSTVLQSEQHLKPASGKGRNVAELDTHQGVAMQQPSANEQPVGSPGSTQAQNSTPHQQDQSAAAERSLDSGMHTSQLPGLQHRSELQTGYPWGATGAEQAEDPTDNVAPADKLPNSLPLGVQGHLYPSPFAMAMDDCNGPLWSWPSGSADVQADATSSLAH